MNWFDPDNKSTYIDYEKEECMHCGKIMSDGTGELQQTEEQQTEEQQKENKENKEKIIYCYICHRASCEKCAPEQWYYDSIYRKKYFCKMDSKIVLPYIQELKIVENLLEQQKRILFTLLIIGKWRKERMKKIINPGPFSILVLRIRELIEETKKEIRMIKLNMDLRIDVIYVP